MNYLKSFVVALALLAVPGVQAMEAGEDGVAYLQQQWAIDNYNLSGKEQVNAFLELMDTADSMIAGNPDDAALYVWRGIIESTFAGVKGGLGALKYAKAARADFEKGISLDPEVLNGSAYTSLGTLYFKVPGWPIGFGDDDKAEELLKKGLALNPQGIDPNYFYAEFLFEAGHYAQSREHLMRALAADPRPGREVADNGRRKEAREVLAEVEAHLQ